MFGKCNNPHGHGHNYMLEVTVAGEPDPVTGMVLDLKELKEILEREVMQRMDHRHSESRGAGAGGQIPTCENIARVIWGLLEPKITQGKSASRAAVRVAGFVCGLLFEMGERPGERMSDAAKARRFEGRADAALPFFGLASAAQRAI